MLGLVSKCQAYHHVTGVLWDLRDCIIGIHCIALAWCDGVVKNDKKPEIAKLCTPHYGAGSGVRGTN